MNPYSSVLALLLLTAALFGLPLLPSLIEFYRKSDVLPLNVVQQHAGEVVYFAHSFRAYINSIQSALEQCSATGNTASGVMPDGAEFLVLGRGEDALTLPLRRPDGSCPFVLASSTALLLPPDMTFTRDVYANGRFIGGDRNRYRAVLAEKEAHLGSGSRVARWMHAGGEFIAEPGCQLLGRVSSDSLIRLKSQSRFVRLNAPRIETGPPAAHASMDSLPRRTVGVASQRVLHNGDFVVNAGETFHGDLVVRGRLRICQGAHIHGSVKSEKDMLLEAEVLVNGSVITEREMRIGVQCVLRGPIIAERTLYIAKGTRCGSPEKQTTVSAQWITVEEGVVVCGTIWAREQGTVMAKV